MGSIIRELEKLFAHKFASHLSPQMSVSVFEMAASRFIGERSRDDKQSLISVFSFYQNLAKEFQSSPELYISQIVQVNTFSTFKFMYMYYSIASVFASKSRQFCRPIAVEFECVPLVKLPIKYPQYNSRVFCVRCLPHRCR